MANTYTDYTSGAGETDFAINFDYLEDYHVIVNIDGTDYDVNSSGGTYTFTISTSPTKKVVISPALSAGQKVRVYRNTRGINNDQVGRLVDFSDGSVIKADDLDTTYLHNLYLAQEASEDPVSTIGTEDGAILTWSETKNRWEVSGTGAVANAVLAYNSSTKKWDVIPLNLQYDSGNATFGFGGTPATTYKHKFYGDLLIRDDDNAVNGAVLTIENTSTSGVTNAVLILASQSPILQFFDTNGSADKKYWNIRQQDGTLTFQPLTDLGADKATVPLKIVEDGGVLMPDLPTADPSVTGELWNHGGFIVLSGSVATIDALSNVNAPTPSSGDILAYNTSTSQWENLPLNIQYDSGNATFGFGGTASTTYKHKFHGDLLVRDDGTSNGAVLTIENASTTGNGNAVLTLASYHPILQFLETNGPADNKYLNVELDNGELKFIPLDDGGAAKDVALKIATNGDGVTVGGTNATLEVIADGAGATDTAQVNIEGSIAVLRLYDTQATADKGLWQLVNNGDALALSLYTDAGSLSKKAIQLTADGYNVYGDGAIEDAAYKHTFHGDVLMHDTDAGSECVLKILTEGTDVEDFAAIILEGTSSVIIFQDTDAPTDKGRAHIGIDNDYLNFAVYNNTGTTLYGVPLQIGTGSNPAAANNSSGEKHNVLLTDLPTSDPGVTNAIWNRNGAVAMSGSSRYLYDSGWVSSWGANTLGPNESGFVTLSSTVDGYFPFQVTVWWRSSSSSTVFEQLDSQPKLENGATLSSGLELYYDSSTRKLYIDTQDLALYAEAPGGGSTTNGAWTSGTNEIRVTIQ